jgi:RNA polymerase sigma factor (sigma-70 family)
MSNHLINPAIKGSLTPDEFEGLLARLGPDRERAGEKYEAVRQKLIKFFEWSACAAAEECADETLDRVARKLSVQAIDDVVGFVWGVARNVRREIHKKSVRTAGLDGLDADHLHGRAGLRAESGPQQEMEDQERLQRLQKCLDRLPERQRALFLEYYNAEVGYEERQKLAGGLKISIATLRVRMNRLREKLERCVTQGRSGGAQAK